MSPLLLFSPPLFPFFLFLHYSSICSHCSIFSSLVTQHRKAEVGTGKSKQDCTKCNVWSVVMGNLHGDLPHLFYPTSYTIFCFSGITKTSSLTCLSCFTGCKYTTLSKYSWSIFYLCFIWSPVHLYFYFFLPHWLLSGPIYHFSGMTADIWHLE